MYLTGHLAVAYLIAERLDRRRLWVMALGALLPDLIDKPRLWLGLTPYGRTIGHSLLVWLWVWVLWALFFRLSGARARAPESGRWLGGLLIGWSSHLLIDLVDDVVEGYERTTYIFSAWFGWPHLNPDMWTTRSHSHLWERCPGATTSLEVLTLLLAAALMTRAGARPSPGAR